MEKARNLNEPVDIYAVQCDMCSKWRVIQDKEEYEAIRENIIEDPWVCSKKSDTSCEDPGDMEYDTSRIWVIDKPNIPKAPCNTKRKLSLRKDFSKFDAYYVMPNGKKVRGTGEVQKFLETYPEYKDQISLSDFNFSVPKILDDMVPRKSVKASLDSNKKMKMSED